MLTLTMTSDLTMNLKIDVNMWKINTTSSPTNDKFPCLSVMQLNIRGLAGKQEMLNKIDKKNE